MKIDFTKLLGFDMVSDELPDGLDFTGDTIGARLGAKVEGQRRVIPKDYQILEALGFEIISRGTLKGPRNPESYVCDKFGAKVGPPEREPPTKQTVDFQTTLWQASSARSAM